MYRIGRASVVPVPYSYGVGQGALFASCSLIVTLLFNICRLGYAVVSGPRETGQECYTTDVRTTVRTELVIHLPHAGDNKRAVLIIALPPEGGVS